MRSLKTSIVLNAVSDDASLELFKLVALTNGTSEVLRSRMDLTRKQYYSRLYNLVRCGLIIRKDRKYFLTALGRLMYDAQISIGNAISDYWKIKAIDSIIITRHSIGRAEETHRDPNRRSGNQECTYTVVLIPDSINAIINKLWNYASVSRSIFNNT